MKILKHLYEQCDLDSDGVEQLKKFVREECNEDDMYEFVNIVVTLSGMDKDIIADLWSVIEK